MPETTHPELSPTPPLMQRLARNLAEVRAEIDAAAARSGRSGRNVRLVVVTKYAEPGWIRGLLELGVTELGESRVQALVRRAELFSQALPAGTAPPVWHMIGHLQRNKVRSLLRVCRIIHSLDSTRLIDEVQAEAARRGLLVEGFIELNLSGEPAKTGAPPEQAESLAAAAVAAGNIRLLGLMTMAPYEADMSRVRGCFSRLREMLKRLRQRGVVPPDCAELSMGMSGDFPVAVEEGATIVRIGSRIFEGLAGTPDA